MATITDEKTERINNKIKMFAVASKVIGAVAFASNNVRL